jgi:hypothetical protein
MPVPSCTKALQVQVVQADQAMAVMLESEKLKISSRI